MLPSRRRIDNCVSSPISLGIWPSRLLSYKKAVFKFVRSPIAAGMVPTTLLLLIQNCSKSLQSPTTSGMLPVNSLRDNLKAWRLRSRVRLLGIRGPVNKFLSASIKTRFVNLPRLAGRDEDKELAKMFRFCSSGNVTISSGIVPARLLKAAVEEARSGVSYVRDDMD